MNSSTGTVVFLFSSRRRHTRFGRDWSSDVCSSDLLVGGYYTFEASAAGYITVSRSGLVTGNSNTTVNISLDVIAGGPVTYVYDELGRLVSASTPTETVTYNYDAVGNLLSIQRQSSSQVAITE